MPYWAITVLVMVYLLGLMLSAAGFGRAALIHNEPAPWLFMSVAMLSLVWPASWAITVVTIGIETVVRELKSGVGRDGGEGSR